jgi:hypothetical protein
MYKYKTKDGSDVVIPGVGVTEDGIITTDQVLESPNLELVEGSTEVSPNHVAGVAPQTQQGAQPVQGVAPQNQQPIAKETV